MKMQTIEAHWIESRSDYSTEDLAALSGMPLALLQELVDLGALPPGPLHRAESVVLVRSARRLRDDFDLEANGLAVALSLLRRIRALERELADVRARSPIDVR